MTRPPLRPLVEQLAGKGLSSVEIRERLAGRGITISRQRVDQILGPREATPVRDQVIQVRVTGDEMAVVDAAAARAGSDRSGFTREAALERARAPKRRRA